MGENRLDFRHWIRAFFTRISPHGAAGTLASAAPEVIGSVRWASSRISLPRAIWLLAAGMLIVFMIGLSGSLFFTLHRGSPQGDIETLLKEIEQEREQRAQAEARARSLQTQLELRLGRLMNAPPQNSQRDVETLLNQIGHERKQRARAQAQARSLQTQLNKLQQAQQNVPIYAQLFTEIHNTLGETRKAIEYHVQALMIDRELGDRRGEGADLNNLGNAYADLGKARKAIEYYEQALVKYRESGDRHGEGQVLGNLGNAYNRYYERKSAPPTEPQPDKKSEPEPTPVQAPPVPPLVLIIPSTTKAFWLTLTRSDPYEFPEYSIELIDQQGKTVAKKRGLKTVAEKRSPNPGDSGYLSFALSCSGMQTGSYSLLLYGYRGESKQKLGKYNMYVRLTR